MTYTYRYNGDLPTVFISLSKEGHTWVPETGDTITTVVPVAHPLLELIDQHSDEEPDTLAVVEDPIQEIPESTVPVQPEKDKPATADAKEN